MNAPSVVYRGYTYDLRVLPGYTGAVSATDKMESAPAPTQSQVQPDNKQFSNKNFGRFDHLDPQTEILDPAFPDNHFVMIDFAQELLAAEKLREARCGGRDMSCGGTNADRGQPFVSYSMTDDHFLSNAEHLDIRSWQGSFDNYMATQSASFRYNDDWELASDHLGFRDVSLGMNGETLGRASEDFRMSSDSLYRPADRVEPRTTRPPTAYHHPPLSLAIDTSPKGPGVETAVDSLNYMYTSLEGGEVRLDISEPDSRAGSFTSYDLVLGQGFRLDIAALTPEKPILLGAARFGLKRDTLHLDTGVLMRDKGVESFSSFAPGMDRRVGRDEAAYVQNRNALPTSVVNRKITYMDRQDYPTGVLGSWSYSLNVARMPVGLEQSSSYVYHLPAMPSNVEWEPMRIHEVAQVAIGSRPDVFSLQREPVPIDYRIGLRYVDEYPTGAFTPLFDSAEGSVLSGAWRRDASLYDYTPELNEAYKTETIPFDYPGNFYYWTYAARVQDPMRDYTRREWSDYEVTNVEKQVDNKRIEQITENHLYGRDDPRIQEVVLLKERVDTFALVKAVQFDSENTSDRVDIPRQNARTDAIQYTTKGLLIDAITWGWGGDETVDA